LVIRGYGLSTKNPRLSVDDLDRQRIARCINLGIKAEAVPEELWALFDLLDRVTNPHKGHPRRLTIENASAAFYYQKQLREKDGQAHSDAGSGTPQV
jgi:hypothetical protein